MTATANDLQSTPRSEPAASTSQPPPQDRFLSPTGVAAIFFSLLGWTTIPLFLRYFVHDIDGWTANGWRYAISALIWAPSLLYSIRKGTLPKGIWTAALVPSFWNAAAQVCFALAPYYITPGLMTFSLRLQIVFLALAAAIMFPAERRVLKSPAFVACLVVVLLATMSTVALSPKGLGSGEFKGIALAIGAGVGYAMYALNVRKYMVGINPIQAFAAVSQYTAAAMVACMLIFAQDHGWHAVDALDGYKWMLLIASSVIGIGLGHTFYFYSIARLGLVVAAGVIQLQPITVSIASIYIFNEPMTKWQWVTGLVAVAGAISMLVVQNQLLKRQSSAK